MLVYRKDLVSLPSTTAGQMLTSALAGQTHCRSSPAPVVQMPGFRRDSVSHPALMVVQRLNLWLLLFLMIHHQKPKALACLN